MASIEASAATGAIRDWLEIHSRRLIWPDRWREFEDRLATAIDAMAVEGGIDETNHGYLLRSGIKVLGSSDGRLDKITAAVARVTGIPVDGYATDFIVRSRSGRVTFATADHGRTVLVGERCGVDNVIVPHIDWSPAQRLAYPSVEWTDDESFDEYVIRAGRTRLGEPFRMFAMGGVKRGIPAGGRARSVPFSNSQDISPERWLALADEARDRRHMADASRFYDEALADFTDYREACVWLARQRHQEITEQGHGKITGNPRHDAERFQLPLSALMRLHRPDLAIGQLTSADRHLAEGRGAHASRAFLAFVGGTRVPYESRVTAMIEGRGATSTTLGLTPNALYQFRRSLAPNDRFDSSQFRRVLAMSTALNCTPMTFGDEDQVRMGDALGVALQLAGQGRMVDAVRTVHDAGGVDLAGRLRSIRRARFLSYPDFEQSIQAMKDIEGGHVLDPSRQVLHDVSATLQIPVDFLLSKDVVEARQALRESRRVPATRRSSLDGLLDSAQYAGRCVFLIRTAVGKSQRELGPRQAIVGQVEAGDYGPSNNRQREWARQLDVHPRHLAPPHLPRKRPSGTASPSQVIPDDAGLAM